MQGGARRRVHTLRWGFPTRGSVAECPRAWRIFRARRTVVRTRSMHGTARTHQRRHARPARRPLLIRVSAFHSHGRASLPACERVRAHGLSGNAVPSHVLTGVSGAERNQDVVNELQMERPLQYLELEQLLHSVSDKLHTSNNQTWIAPSQTFARGSWPRPASRAAAQRSRPASRSEKRAGESDGYKGENGLKGRAAVASAAGARPALEQGRMLHASEEDAGEKGGNPLKEFRLSEESMDILPKSRGEKVDRTQSVMTGKQPLPITEDQVLRPIRKKPKSVDELDMQAKQVEYASNPPAALSKGQTFQIDHLKGMFPDSEESETFQLRKGGLKRQMGKIDPIEVALPTESAHVRDQLRRFVYGQANKHAPVCTLLPPAKKFIWREELKRNRLELFAAILVQNAWRSWQRRKKYLKYSVNKLSRSSQRMKSIMTVWLRASRQREHEHHPGSNVRGLMSYWLIRFNVSVKNATIAREKAADCHALWASVWLKRIVRNWRRIVDIILFDRHHRMHTWLVPWKDLYSDGCLVREAARKAQRRFLHAAFRCLLFYARCSAKLKLRASKLFRLEEESVYELLMPIQRFPGYFYLFQPNEILEKFRRKDWYERRVYRQCYKRRIPWVFTLWNTVADEGRKWRVVVGAYDRLVLNKAFSAFCFLLELNDLGQRVHNEVEAEMDEEKRLEEEATKKLVVQQDALKELETDIEDLSGLVDYEYREMMRSFIRDEKHKTMFRIRYDALEKERKNVGILLAQVSGDLEASEMEQKAAEEAAIEKRREHDELVDILRQEENTKWNKNVQNVYDLFMRATDMMGDLLEKAHQAHRARRFRICWRTLCKPAFRVRIRRVLNRAQIKRLLNICFQFLKMERSIYKYYPLRVKFYAMLRWFKQVEFKYQHTSYGLKTRVRRRQDLYMALDRALRAFIGAQTFARTPNKQEFHTLSFVILRWKEHVQSVIARREVMRLFHRRRAIHVASRCFDFMKHGVPVCLPISASLCVVLFLTYWNAEVLDSEMLTQRICAPTRTVVRANGRP